MRLRDLLTSGVFLAVAALHFGLQWYAWKIHLGEVPPLLGWQGDDLWRVCSFPLFAMLSRRLQHLYFFELLVSNSALWGAVLVWGSKGLFGLFRRGKRRVRTSGKRIDASLTPRTDADRLVELKKLLDQGLITGEEFQDKREAILKGL